MLQPTALRRVATLVAKNEFWLLWVYGVPLLLSSSLPLWLLAAALTTIPFFWLARRSAHGRWSRTTPLGLPILLLLLLGLVAVAVSLDQTISLRSYGELLGGVGLYYGLVNGLDGLDEKGVANRLQSGVNRRFDFAVWILIGLAVAMGAVGWLGLNYLDKFLPMSQIYPYLPKVDFSLLNGRGFTPNIVAGAVAPVIPLCWAFALMQPLKRRVLLLLVSLFLVGVVVLTQSRGAVLGIGVGLAILFVWRAPKLLWLAPVLVVAIAALIQFVGLSRLADMVLAIDATGSAAGRLELWSRALYIMQDFPFTGIGLGTFQQVVPMLYPLFVNDPTAPLPHAHNLYLQMGIDYGIGGLVAFVGLVTTALLIGLATMRLLRETKQGWLAAGLVAGYVVYLTHNLLDAVALSTKVSVVAWFLLALLTVLHQSLAPADSEKGG